MEKKIGLILFFASVVLCGCPGILMLLGSLTAIDSNSNISIQMVGLGIILIIIPIIFTIILIKTKQTPSTINKSANAKEWKHPRVGGVFIKENKEGLNIPLINEYTGEIMDNITKLLKNKNITISKKEITARTTINVNWSSTAVGRYSNGSAATCIDCRIEIIDNLMEKTITTECFTSAVDQRTTNMSVQVYNRIDSYKIIDFLEPLFPKKPYN